MWRFDSVTGNMITLNNAIAIWKERSVSWSQLSSFKYSKDQWANKYIYGHTESANNGMLYGNVVGDSLGTPESLVPNLNPYLVGIKEYELKVKLNKHQLVGYCDHYCPNTLTLNENKTSQKLTRWDQTEVDNHGQLTMYALMLYLKEGTKPENLNMWLNFIPVKEGGDFQLDLVSPDLFHRFQTKRTTMQCLQFGADIDKQLKEMEKYALSLDFPCTPA